MSDLEQTPMAVLKEAEGMVEAASDFGIRAANWEIQKRHEAQWAVPVIQVLQGLPPARVLDLGCGYGSLAVSAALLGHEVVAVDWFVPSPAIDGIEWRHQDIQAPGSLPDGSFRLVVMTEVLEHLNFHPGALFDEVHSRLRPGGLFVGATPAPENWQEDLPVKRVEDMPSWSADVELVDAHVHFYSEEELVSLLSDAGFAIASMVLLRGGHRRFWEARR